jgi:hypothetical protein
LTRGRVPREHKSFGVEVGNDPGADGNEQGERQK